MEDIILIGPVGVGKTTTAKLLAEKLNKPLVSMDDLRLGYYKEIGYDDNHRAELKEKIGQKAVYQYWKVFDAHSVERILEDHENCIFDFGGGSTVMEFDVEFKRIQTALAPYSNVVLLTPSSDKHESLEIIYKRKNVVTNGWNLLQHFVFNGQYEKLAKQTVFVKDKTAEQVCDEVLSIVQ